MPLPTTRDSERATSRVARLRAAAIGLAFALALGEIVVRQVYYVPWELDPEFGCIVLPGTTARYRLEGDGVSRWTTHGVRAPQPPDPARRPILVLGDSFTEAYQVDDAEAFPSRLERDLASDVRVPVVNAGRSAASPADYVAYAARNVRYFNPRWVVIQLNEEDLTGDAWTADKAHFVEQGGHLEAVPVPLRTQSAIARLLWRARQSSALLNYAIIRVQSFAQAAGQASPLFSATEPRPVAPPVRRFDADAIHAELAAMAGAYDGRVTFLLLPPLNFAAPTARGPVEQAFATACRNEGWSCVDLRSGYPDFAARRVSPFGFSNSTFNVGHMNPAGHGLAADLLTVELRRLHADALL
jgi:GDSL-like lipase/acylhydrolase family protein